jgi:hypothetical protein
MEKITVSTELTKFNTIEQELFRRAILVAHLSPGEKDELGWEINNLPKDREKQIREIKKKFNQID